MNLFDFQQRGVDYGFEVLHDVWDGPTKRMLAAPTGCGKSYIKKALLEKVVDHGVNAGIITASPGIRGDLIEKGIDPVRVWTPITYINAVTRGDIPPFDAIIGDEGHHATADTYRQAYGTAAKVVILTATPYRGTPKGTRELRAEYGEPYVLITVREAHDRPDIPYTIPTFKVRPLFDDDTLEVENGEFKSSSVDSMILPHLPRVCGEINEGFQADSTCIVSPSTAIAKEVEARLIQDYGLPVVTVTADTPFDQRRSIFDAAERREILLNTVAILKEGIDIRLRNMFCLKPMRSPVALMQTWGRMTRHNDPWICDYSRNLERGAHLFEGYEPVLGSVAEVQQGFGGPSKRGAARALDIEAVSGYKCIPVPLLGGLWAESYTIYNAEPGAADRGEYVIVLPPWLDKPVCAYRSHNRARWTKSEVPLDLLGYRTHTGRDGMSDKQKDWYLQDAAKVGLNPEAELSKRQFAVFAALMQSHQNVRR